MKKLLAILLALVTVLALAVPTYAEEIVVFENEAGDTMSGSDAYLDPWGSFAEGPFWGSDHDAFPGIDINNIKKYAKQDDVLFKMIFSCTSFATWSGNNGPIARFNAWDEGAYDAPFTVVAQGDNMYLGTVKLSDVAAKYIAVTGDEELAQVVNMAIQPWVGELKLYKAWIEIPEEEIVISDEEVMNAIEKQVGSLDGVSGGQQVIPLGNVVNTGETVVLHLVGTSDGPFRYWLSQGTWTSKSAITTVEDAEFDILVEVTATGDGANEVQFKGPYGGELNNLTLTRVGVFFGTMDEYDAAFEAKKAELIEAAKKAKDGKYSGYLSTGDDYHMVIINSAVITTPHEYDDANVCVYCGHVGAEDEIIIEVTDPVEPSTDEEEDVTVDVEEPADEPAEEENPKTGLALAIIPMIVAAAAVVISKR